MNSIALDANYGRSAPLSLKVLEATATSCTIIGLANQLAFGTYVLLAYGSRWVMRGLASWNDLLPHGYVVGDTLGNGAMTAHLALAGWLMIAGGMQLVPLIRAKWSRVHRWNGRIYALAAVTASISGVYIVWTRGAVGDTSQHVSITVNALLILLCAGYAGWYAVKRDIAAHERWALRLFLVVGGVWFFRLFVRFWIFINGGPAGFDPRSFSGPALTAIGILQYALPLALLEAYFVAKRNDSSWIRFITAVGLGAMTIVIAVGSALASGRWLSRVVDAVGT